MLFSINFKSVHLSITLVAHSKYKCIFLYTKVQLIHNDCILLVRIIGLLRLSYLYSSGLVYI